jgi:cyclohexadienyl dehydratase
VPLVQRSSLPKIKGWGDLNQKGVNVAVLMGTVFEEQAKHHFPNATVKSIQKPANGYQEVLAGRADATITSNVEAATLMQTYPNLTMIGSTTEMRNKRPFAYPMPQGDAAWLTYVNNWVALKKSEGFFQDLEAKWMPRK